MSSLSLFSIGTTDLSDYIVQDTYAINSEPVYKEYEDANGTTHRRHIRYKVQGKMQMYFPDLESYSDFKELLESKRSNVNHTVPCTLYDNSSGDTVTINAFVDYKPTLKRTASLREYLDKFDVSIEEQ